MSCRFDKTRAPAFAHRGIPESGVPLRREPTESQWLMLRELGFYPARLGEPYPYQVADPVTGDGYWYTRRELVDAETGERVGSVPDPNGPGGEL